LLFSMAMLLAMASLVMAGAPPCVSTNATSLCVDPATGDLAQLNGHAMLPGSGTALQDCVAAAAALPPTIQRLADGGLRVTRNLTCAPNAYHDTPAAGRRAAAVVVDTFTPAADGTITWAVSVAGLADDALSRWSTPVQTALGYRDWPTTTITTEQGSTAADGACGVSLVQQTSHTACLYGSQTPTFGCADARTMFVQAGCSGRFTCGGAATTGSGQQAVVVCDSVNFTRAECSCAAAAAAAAAWVGGPHTAALPNATFDPLAPFAVDRPAASYGDFFYGTPYSDISKPGSRGPGDSGRATHLPVLARVDSGGTNATTAAATTAVVQALDYIPIVSKTNVGVASPATTHGGGSGGGGGGSGGGGGGVWLNYTRLYERLGGATPHLTFTQHVLALPTDDWRPVVAWLNARFPGWFEPRPRAHALDWEGPASYADLRGERDFPAADAPHYAAMGYKLNWDSTARFPWHGEWVPTDADGFNGRNWTSCFAHDAPDAHVDEKCATVSYAELSGWYAHHRALGFRTCNYANLFQFGWNTKRAWTTDGVGGGAPTAGVNCSAAATGGADQKSQEQALLCHTQRLLAPGVSGGVGGYGPALLVRASAAGAGLGDAAQTPPLSCMGLDGSCGMDPHPDLPYLAHVLDMARTGLARTNSSGVCIDRADWIRYVNPRADDGRTWFPYFGDVQPLPNTTANATAPRFGPVRAMIFSWHLAMAALAKVMDGGHYGGKAIIINDHVNRIGMMQHVDGIYAEMGDVTPAGFTHVVGSALTAMHKPVVSWIHGDSRHRHWPDYLEQALQGYLYLGVYPTVPVKNNDHAIGGGCAPNCTEYGLDALFKDYGPLFTALRGKRWVLEAHAAEMQGVPPVNGSGRVNVFETRHNGGFVAVIAQVPAPNASVVLALPGCTTPAGTALHPGGGRVAVAIESANSDGRFAAVVPVVRQCAVVVITCGGKGKAGAKASP